MLFEGGAFFETPPPAYEGGGMFKPDRRAHLGFEGGFYYAYTLDSRA